MAWNLAELYVSLTTKGFEVVRGQFDAIKEKCEIVAASANAAGDKMAAAFQGAAPKIGGALQASFAAIKSITPALQGAYKFLGNMKEGAEAFAKVTRTLFAPLTAGILAFAAAGSRGTTAGNALTTQFGLLSREIASLFLPQIQMLIQGIQKLTGWFRSLSGTQQSMIAAFVLGATVMIAVTAIVPVLIGGIISLITSLYALALAEDVASAGFTLIGQIAGVVVGALAGLTAGTATFAVMTEKGRAGLSRLGDALKPVWEALGRLYDKLSPLIAKLEAFAGKLLEANFEVMLTGLLIVVDALDRMATGLMFVVDKLDKLIERFEIVKGFAKIGGFGLLGMALTTKTEPGSPHMTAPTGHIGFSSAADTYKRIAEAGLSNEVPRKQLRVAEESKSYLGYLVALTEKILTFQASRRDFGLTD